MTGAYLNSVENGGRHAELKVRGADQGILGETWATRQVSNLNIPSRLTSMDLNLHHPGDVPVACFDR